jgi:hypothetical protein
MVRETPELYEQVVKPYIAALPASRLQWCFQAMALMPRKSFSLIQADSVPQGVQHSRSCDGKRDHHLRRHRSRDGLHSPS